MEQPAERGVEKTTSDGPKNSGQITSMLSLDEIATDLTVSVNTIKSHVRSIYTKLGVSSRRTAVLSAHETGLLTSVHPS